MNKRSNCTYNSNYQPYTVAISRTLSK